MKVQQERCCSVVHKILAHLLAFWIKRLASHLDPAAIDATSFV